MASSRPIFVATHPRACSTAFERVRPSVVDPYHRTYHVLTRDQVFMTRRDVLKCIHEPFGDAFYFGPERLGHRYEEDETARLESGFSNTTFKTVMDQVEEDATEVRASSLCILAPAHSCAVTRRHNCPTWHPHLGPLSTSVPRQPYPFPFSYFPMLNS